MTGINGSLKEVRPLFLVLAAGIIMCLSLPVIAIADDDAGSESGVDFQSFGFIEFDGLVNTLTDQDFSDAVKKNEFRYHLEMKYGTNNLYIFMMPDFYYDPNLFDQDPAPYRYSGKQRIANNLRISGSDYEIALNELYINYLIYPLRLRLGNQLISWGTADVINPTSYFTPYDFREFLFRDDDEFKQGVPSLSAMYFNDNFTLELVLSFLHVPTLFAPSGNFWSLDMRDDVFNIIIPEGQSLDPDASNAGFGARISKTLFQTDFSLSYYHGPDNDPVLVPDSVLFVPNEPLSITMNPQYHVVNTFGVDASMGIGDFTFQLEAAYTPDKHGAVNQDLNDPAAIQWPFQVRTSEYIAYAAGFNYFIPISAIFESHTGDLVFTLDWYQSRYSDDELYGSYVNDLLTLRLQDSFLDGRLNVQFTSIFETQNNGTIFWPEIEYGFNNGLSIKLAYADINGDLNSERIEPLFYHFRDNDFVTLKIRYRLGT